MQVGDGLGQDGGGQASMGSMSAQTQLLHIPHLVAKVLDGLLALRGVARNQELQFFGGHVR